MGIGGDADDGGFIISGLWTGCELVLIVADKAVELATFVFHFEQYAADGAGNGFTGTDGAVILGEVDGGDPGETGAMSAREKLEVVSFAVVGGEEEFFEGVY